MTDTAGPSYRDNPDNYCYRHPNRQSFVLCQRCARTICPECMTQAPVGYICPECMKDQKKNRTPAQKRAEKRWGTGSRAVSFGSSSTRGTTTIFVVTAVVYLLQMLGSIIPGLNVQSWLMFWAPLTFAEPWRILTAAFVHGGVWHVALNMLTLWMVGRALEPALGTWRFVTTYLLSAAGGSAAVALLGFWSPVVGASGALFGLFGALLVIGRAVGANLSGLYLTLGINLVMGFVPGLNISWQAHVGGLIFGALIGFIFTRTRRPNQKRLQIGLLCGVGVVIAALLAVPQLTGFALSL